MLPSTNFIKILVYCTLITVLCTVTNGKKGFGPGEQDWGHIKVRDGAYMFYWLYYTTSTQAKNYTESPLVIWLQGGPGASSTGYGNFEELGPLDLQLNYRNHTWIKDVNVLFIDNPVGTGFSYVDSYKYLTQTNKQIALDLVEFMKQFYGKHKEFITVPLHIFSESYGGKMAAEFALELYKAKQSGKIKTNLKSVSLGNSWISPIDSVKSWAPLLLNMGIIDYDGFNEIEKSADNVDVALKNKLYQQATDLWGRTQMILLRKSENIDFYNILKQISIYNFRSYSSQDSREIMFKTLVEYNQPESFVNDLDSLMQGPVSKALSIPNNVVWGSQSKAVFTMLREDFMKPVIEIIERLFVETDLHVIVYSGQLDLICATPGTVNWIEKMNIPKKWDYPRAKRIGYIVNGFIEGFKKSAGNFTMYWVNRAGHMVPDDNPIAMAHILKSVTNHK